MGTKAGQSGPVEVFTKCTLDMTDKRQASTISEGVNKHVSKMTYSKEDFSQCSRPEEV